VYIDLNMNYTNQKQQSSANTMNNSFTAANFGGNEGGAPE
jgi:hypothetical protein